MAARLVPTLRYRDVATAVDWLCSAFGFKRVRVVTGVDGSVLQAHLAFGNDIIVLLQARDSGTDAVAPDLAVAELQSCYFVVDDADQHHRNARAAGAQILDIRQYDLGGRGYSCRDPEGHVWSFGTYNPRQPQFEPVQKRHEYDPWTGRPPTSKRSGHSIADTASSGLRPKITLASVTTALATVVVMAATIGWLLGALPHPAVSARNTQDSKLVSRLVDDSPGKVIDNPTPLSTERAQAPERPLLFGSSALQQSAVEEEKPAAPRAPQLAKEPTPELAASLAAVQQVNERDQETAAREAAERSALDALKQWREAQEKLRQLARERSAKEAAEQAELEARQRAAKAARAPVKGEPPKRPVAAKEAPKPASKETPAKPTGIQGIVVETAKTDPGKATMQKPAQQPTARAAEVPVRTSRTDGPETSRPEPPRRTDAASSISSDQVWDCVPRPPDNKVICHPIPNRP